MGNYLGVNQVFLSFLTVLLTNYRGCSQKSVEHLDCRKVILSTSKLKEEKVTHCCIVTSGPGRFYTENVLLL